MSAVTHFNVNHLDAEAVSASWARPSDFGTGTFRRHLAPSI
jgi:hypothetical protein